MSLLEYTAIELLQTHGLEGAHNILRLFQEEYSVNNSNVLEDRREDVSHDNT